MSSDDGAGGCDDAARWRESGRKAVADRLERARFDVDDALAALTVETMLRGDDPSAAQVREARRALNRCRRVLEETVAPAAGAEPWADPVPGLPAGRAREVYGVGDGADATEEADE